MEALAGREIVNLLLRRGTAALEPLLDADMMCVCLGWVQCACEKQPSESDPWSSFAAPQELPKRATGPELFLDVEKKVRTSPGGIASSLIGRSHQEIVGHFSSHVPFKNLCPRPYSSLLLSLFSPL